MQMVAFRVQNYRSILDSGWIETGELTTIVGKNESGKTSLLRALWKFHPFTDTPYDLDREWPRGRRRAMADDQPVVTVRFSFTPEEQAQLWALDLPAGSLNGVEVQRNYRGEYTTNFDRNPQDRPGGLQRIYNTVKQHLDQAPPAPLPQLQAGCANLLDDLLRSDDERTAPDTRAMLASGRQAVLASPAVRRSAAPASPEGMRRHLEQMVEEMRVKTPEEIAVGLVRSWLPTFIYMDDYKVFTGAAFLQELLERRRAHRLSEEDRTVLQIMAMAGLDLEEEVRKGQSPDREQRMLDMNDASQTLTRELAHRWSQKQYEVMFQVDGQHFITFVKDAETSILVPLEERSKGFQWFFSFDMTFMYETQGSFHNAVLLLDEPGLHLHAAAQHDLRVRLRAYAQHNQLLYTTHLPYMIDLAHLDEVRIVEDRGYAGTVVCPPGVTEKRDTHFTLFASLGMRWFQTLNAGQALLLVHSLADYWYFATLSRLLGMVGYPELDPRLRVLPAWGDGAGYAAGHDLPVIALETAADEAPTGVRPVPLRDLLAVAYPCTLEDFFPEAYYLAQAQSAYAGELQGAPLTLRAASDRAILPRVREALAARGIADFTPERVAQTIIPHLTAHGLAVLPAEHVRAFAALIARINSALGG